MSKYVVCNDLRECCSAPAISSLRVGFIAAGDRLDHDRRPSRSPARMAYIPGEDGAHPFQGLCRAVCEAFAGAAFPLLHGVCRAEGFFIIFAFRMINFEIS